MKTFHSLRPKASSSPLSRSGRAFLARGLFSLPPASAQLLPAHRTYAHCSMCVSQQPQDSQVTGSPPDGTDTGGPAAPQMSGAWAAGQQLKPNHQSPRHWAAWGLTIWLWGPGATTLLRQVTSLTPISSSAKWGEEQYLFPRFLLNIERVRVHEAL